MKERLGNVQDVVGLCKDSMDTISDSVMGVVTDSNILVCLCVYTALSLLWTVTRLTYIWWKGPNGGHFPPDVLCVRVLISAGHYLSEKFKSRSSVSLCEENDLPVNSEQAARIASLKELIRQAVARKRNNRNPEEVDPYITGMPGPSYRLATDAEAGAKSNPLAPLPIAVFRSAPSVILLDRVTEWVEESADSGRASVPTSDMDSMAGHASDVPEERSSSPGEGSTASTMCGESTSGTSNLDSPCGSSMPQVRFVTLV